MPELSGRRFIVEHTSAGEGSSLEPGRGDGAAGELGDIQTRARRAVVETLDKLVEVAAGRWETVTVTEYPNGKSQVSRAKVGPRDMAAAVKTLAELGRLPTGAPANTAALGDPAAIAAALYDPAVRKYLATAYPELAPVLRLIAAVPADHPDAGAHS